MNHSLDWDQVHLDFPVNAHLIWLNNCGTTPASTPVVDKVTQWLGAYSRQGALAEGYGYVTVKASLHRRLALLIGATPGEMVLTHNTAEGMNILSQGWALEPGDEILLLENEYPSNVYPWMHWQERGVLLRTVPMNSNAESFLEGFKSALTPRTKLATMSAVHWCTGMPLPISQVGTLCKENGTELVVDGSQGVGMLDVNVGRQNIGYMAFSAWKWLLGPVGVGAMYIASEKLESIRPVFRGTASVVDEQAYLPYKFELKPNADRFLYSTGNMNDWIYFDASLAYLEAIGFENVRTRIHTLAEHLSNGLKNLGFNVLVDSFGTPTGIVSAAKPGLNAGNVVRDLKSRGIIAAERLDRIRFAPHIYNSFGQLDKVLSALASM